MLKTRQPVLLLIDLQHDYLNATALEPCAGSVVTRASQLLDAARMHSIPVVHVWTTVTREPDTRMPHWKASETWRCLKDTYGHQTPESLRPLPGEIIVHKTFFSAFSSESLDPYIASTNPSYLVLAGIHLHACIRATALDAYQREMQTFIAHDATGSDDPLHSTITRRYLEKRSFRFESVASISSQFSESANKTNTGQPETNSILLTSPLDPAVTWRAPITGEAEVKEAAGGTRRARADIGGMGLEERSRAIARVIRGIETKARQILEAMVQETGKPVLYARSEIEATTRMLSKISSRMRCEQNAENAEVSERRRPIGNVAVITSWNNPVYIPLGKIIPALIYGNTVVWKPAEEAIQTSAIVDSIVGGAFPRDAMATVNGDADSGDALINCPEIDGVSFTGSLSAGRSVQLVCARRFIPLQAELGGNNAAIVLDDCDIDLAAREIARGAFALAGQRCTATRRAIVMRSVSAEFTGRLQAACSEMTWGIPSDETVQIGPLISCEHRLLVEQTVERAAENDCPVEHLHPRWVSDADVASEYYYPPTIVCCDQPESEIVQEELFAPVLVIQPADSFDKALMLCNDVKQGLAASLFTSSECHIARFLEEADAGILKINQATDGAEPDVPFGGWKASGVGPAEHGPSDREFYTRVQAVYC